MKIPAWIVRAAEEWEEGNGPGFISACAKTIASYAPNLDDIDEQSGRLLKAIETALSEMNSCKFIEAGITLTMALKEHEARLVELTKKEIDR